MTIHAVNDFLSNVPENIEIAAEALGGNSKTRRKVFDAVYTGKAQQKMVRGIMKSRRLTQQQVLKAARALDTFGLIRIVKPEGRIVLEKVSHIQQFKSRILRHAADPKKRRAMATKRRPAGSTRDATVTVRVQTKGLKVRMITLNELDTFAKAKKLQVSGYIPASVSEVQFRNAVRRILGEHGDFKDWGGEANDLFTSRLMFKGRRIAAAYAFKGPGTQGKLTPKKMGKNGDQIQRLFGAPAELFIVQYGGQVGQSVYTDMLAHAYYKAAALRQPIYYCVIDGTDSHRLLKAYPAAFAEATPKKKSVVPRRPSP